MPELQQIWTDVRPAQGEWMIPKGGQPDPKTIDGVRVDGPPYPRLRKRRHGLYCSPICRSYALGYAHSGHLTRSASTRRPLVGWTRDDGIGLSALPTRHGPCDTGGKKGTKERRIVPEWLPVLKRHGVDAISFSGPVRSQFSPKTIQRAEDNIRALGLSAVSIRR